MNRRNSHRRSQRTGKIRHIWAIAYGITLTLFTVYLALDTFVIARVYTDASNDAEVTQVAYETPSTVGISTENHYKDENMEIILTEYWEQDTAIYVAEVKLSNAHYLQTAFAQDAYGRNVTEKTSEISARSGAILAINGDYYGVQETGYVIRNGILYRSNARQGQEDLAIYADGSFGIVTEGDISAEALLAEGAVQVLGFGPALVQEGVVTVSQGDEVGKARASNPRTAIGIIEPLHYIFVVADGRTEESAGLSLRQLAEFMQARGTQTAYNLDGGGSSTMIFQGELINKPTSSGQSIEERSVSDIVFIGY